VRALPVRIRRVSMKLGRTSVLAAVLALVGGLAHAAALPKPTSLVDKVATSQSRGIYGIGNTRYNKVTWGNRWRQSLGRAPIIISPYIRGY
jgi:hypothetical protein